MRALLAAVAIVLVVDPFDSDSFEAPTLSQWQAPTDAFLEIPGIEWLRSVPTLDLGPPALAWDEPSQKSNSSPSGSRRLES